MLKELLELLLSFLQIGLFSIGGGYATIPLIQEQIVTSHGWLTLQEFTDIITISQMTPGPLAVNSSSFVGIQVAGIAGAVVATFGCVISGFVVSILLYRFFQSHGNSMLVKDVLGGLRACSVGLIAASAGTILLLAFTPLAGEQVVPVNPYAVVIFTAAMILLRKRKLSPILTILLSGAAGCLIYL